MPTPVNSSHNLKEPFCLFMIILSAATLAHDDEWYAIIIYHKNKHMSVVCRDNYIR